MTDATQTPTLDYAFPSHLEGRCNFLPLSAELQTRCRDELTALKAENTQLREDLAQAREALAPKPVRKLREYVSESCGARYRVSNGRIQFLDVFESEWREPHAVNVDDVVALADLLANPFEPVETVDEVLREMYSVLGASRIVLPEYHEEVITRLRAAFAAEQGGAE